MEKSYYGAQRLLCENGETAELEYYILREPLGAYTGYGAEVVMQRPRDRESAAMRRVTTSRARMDALLRLLCENGVTPCTLRDVLEDELKKG